MKSFVLQPEVAAKIAELYGRMEQAYGIAARQLDFSCQGCPDNCCDSYFLHHTYMEWAYLWEGLQTLSGERRARLMARAADYAAQSEEALARGERPQAMCPLNEDGLCMLYGHRLMICRMHGVPSSLTFPDGRTKKFPGCFRCQELTKGRPAVPAVERTPLLRELALLEAEFLGGGRRGLPRLRKTIADMILLGPPKP